MKVSVTSPTNVPSALSSNVPSRNDLLRRVAGHSPSYPCNRALNALGWGSDEPGHRHVPLSTLQERYAAAGLKTRYYSPEIHVGAFVLPPYIAEKFN